MDRGQIQQVFIFLTAVLVIGASIFLGTRLMGGVKGTACEANDVSFQRDLRDLLEQNAVFGSTNEVSISPPCDAIRLCFVDPASLGQDFRADATIPKTLASAVYARVNTTVYLQGREKTVPVAFDERVLLRASPTSTTVPAPLCIDAVGGRFKFYTEGYGRYVKITGP